MAAVLLFISMSSTYHANYAQATSVKEKAIKAYKSFLSKKSVTLKRPGYSFTETFDLTQEDFAVKDLNADGVPELILDPSYDHGAGFRSAIFVYRNGKVAWLNTSGGTTYYYVGSKVFKVYDLGRGSFGVYYYKIVNGYAKEIASYEGLYTTKEEQCKYYIKNKKVTRKKFNRYLLKESNNKVSLKKEGNYLKFKKINKKNIRKISS